MRHVARYAALDFHGFMFVNERPGLFRVASEANQVLRTCGAQLPRLKPAVLIVAVRALHQSLVHAVMEGPVELLFLVQVAGVAKIRLLGLQQELAFFRVVRIVTVRATNSILQVSGTREISMLFAILVAVEAARADLRGRRVLERENLGLVSAALDVFLAGTVASFAAMPFRAFFLIQHRYVMRRIFVALEKPLDGHVFVAGFAGLGADVKRGIGST